MENFNIIPNAGTYGSAIALINANFQLTKEQLERLAYSREGFCGMYETDDDLEAAYPHPTTGSFAYVGTSFPMTVYLATNGVWAASSSTYSGGEIDLNQYALDADLDSLADRVSALESAGYVFIGVATPNGVPTVTTKSFALAWASGTYTNYGGYTVNAGELAVLLYNGSAWSGIKTDIVAKGVVGGYDTTPTEDSEKPVTSGGVYEALDDLRDDVEDMLANADAEFGTGEKVSDTLIRLALGSRDDVLLTQKTVSNAIFNEINISDIGDLNTLAYQLAPSDSRSLKPTFYTVVATRGALTYRVGSMAVISDNMGHVVTEVMTTHYLLDASGNLTDSHSDDDVFTIYRSISSPTGTWTTWHYVNSSIWTSAINSVRTDLVNYYTKAQTYSKTEVDNLIAGINQFEYVVSNSLPYPSANTMRKIYLIPSAHSVTQNVKDEYITIWDGNIYKWEQIGSTAVDLSGYSTTTEMNTAINAAIASALISYYTKTQVDTLLDEKQNVIDDLATIRSGAASGATAVQPAAIADFATTDYVGEAIDDAIDAIPVDDEPTAGSNNLITSGSVAAIRDLLIGNASTEVTLTKNDGYVTPTGNISDNNVGYYTDPISLGKEEAIVVYTASSNRISVISEYNDGTYTPLLLGNKDIDIFSTYTFVADKDMQVVISGYNRNFSSTTCKKLVCADYTFIDNIFKVLNQMPQPSGTVREATGAFADIHTFPINTFYQCTNSAVYSQIANRPEGISGGFGVYTFAAEPSLGNVKFQILQSGGNKLYVSAFWGIAGWSEWITISDLLNQVPKASGYVPDATGDFADIHTFPVNTFYQCTNRDVYTQITNRPEGMQGGFGVYTFAPSSTDKNVALQILQSGGNKLYLSVKWGIRGWSDWISVADASRAIETIGSINNSIVAAFDNIVSVGDSLTRSTVYIGYNEQTGKAITRQAYNPWPKVVKKVCGLDNFNIFAKSGATSIEIWNEYKDQFAVPQTGKTLCTIYLGTNNWFEDTIETSARESEVENYRTAWADDYTGCMCKIIQTFINLGAKIILIRPHAGGVYPESEVPEGWTLADTNEVIRKMALRFNIPYIDSADINPTDIKYHYWPDLTGSNGLHLNDLGYACFAGKFIEEVNKLDTDMMKLLIPA